MHEARIRMGKHSSSQVVQYVPVEQPAKEVITPAVAKSISGDTYKAQQAQEQEQARNMGIAKTYLNRKYNGVVERQGNNTLGGR